MRVLFAASGGGHLEELVHLGDRLPFDVDESLWVTFDSPQSRSLLAGRDVRYVCYAPPRGGAATLANMASAVPILTRGRFDAAVSTGATVAVSFLPLAGLLGATPYYIESAARLDGPSLTGRLLRIAPWVKLFNQCPRWGGRRWSFAGSVFEAFEPVAPEQTPQQPVDSIGRVVVTVGASETYAFDRLIRSLVRLLPAGADVLWQTGCAQVDDLPIRSRRQVPAADLRQALSEADLVVAHAGVGSALSSLAAGRMPLLVPREAARGEHVDDHQLQIARELQSRGLAVARRVDELTEEDLFAAAGRRVHRLASPPPLTLYGPRRRVKGGAPGAG